MRGSVYRVKNSVEILDPLMPLGIIGVVRVISGSIADKRDIKEYTKGLLVRYIKTCGSKVRLRPAFVSGR